MQWDHSQLTQLAHIVISQWSKSVTSQWAHSELTEWTHREITARPLWAHTTRPQLEITVSSHNDPKRKDVKQNNQKNWLKCTNSFICKCNKLIQLSLYLCVRIWNIDIHVPARLLRFVPQWFRYLSSPLHLNLYEAPWSCLLHSLKVKKWKSRNQTNNATCIGVFNCTLNSKNNLFSPFSRNDILKIPGFPGCIKSNPQFVMTELSKMALRFQKKIQ